MPPIQAVCSVEALPPLPLVPALVFSVQNVSDPATAHSPISTKEGKREHITAVAAAAEKRNKRKKNRSDTAGKQIKRGSTKKKTMQSEREHTEKWRECPHSQYQPKGGRMQPKRFGKSVTAAADAKESGVRMDITLLPLNLTYVLIYIYISHPCIVHSIFSHKRMRIHLNPVRNIKISNETAFEPSSAQNAHSAAGSGREVPNSAPTFKSSPCFPFVPTSFQLSHPHFLLL